MGYEEFSVAMTNKSIRTVNSELAFLADCGVITATQLSNMLHELPGQDLKTTDAKSAQPTPAVPAASMSNLSLNEKQSNLYEPPPGPPPPSYPAYPTPPPSAPPLCHASALYAYNPTDAGDLALIPNDRVAVTEYMNAEWWKGTNERTGQEGIFPRSYVRVEEKGPGGLPNPQQAFSPPVNQPSNYGNMMTDVAQSGSSQNAEPGKPNKGAEMGKKFGKKMGNAAIFGAGATIGSNIVNGIF